MSTAAHVGGIFMVLFGGVASGVMWGITVDRLPVWARMSSVEYATDFRRLLLHVDPMMPIFVSLSAGGAILFALERSGTARSLAWVTVALQALIMVTSVSLAEPVNSKFRRLPEGTPPPDVQKLRVFWRRFHSVRTAVSLAAFILAFLALGSH